MGTFLLVGQRELLRVRAVCRELRDARDGFLTSEVAKRNSVTGIA